MERLAADLLTVPPGAAPPTLYPMIDGPNRCPAIGAVSHAAKRTLVDVDCRPNRKEGFQTARRLCSGGDQAVSCQPGCFARRGRRLLHVIIVGPAAHPHSNGALSHRPRRPPSFDPK